MHKKPAYWLLFSLLFLIACNSDVTPTPIIPEPTPEPEPATPTAVLSTDPVRGQAIVDSIQVMVLESFPVQVNVQARGELPDGCTSVEEIVTQQTGSTFRAIITTLRDPGAGCTMALVPFEETISLDVDGLLAGTYDVMVNGISGSFTLDVDNFVAEEVEEATPEPTATPVEVTLGTINGRIWHDLCVGTGGQVGEDEETAVGCIIVATDAGQVLQANGTLEPSESGIAGVEVALSNGECPGEAATTALSDDNGDFSFGDLEAGTYCLSVEAESNVNTAVLESGVWSSLPNDSTSTAITIADGKTAGADFGWDYEFLPEPEVDLANCANDASFVADLTTPDDTIIAPGAEFEVGWRIRNTGTCPWSTDYSAVFVGGDNLGADSVNLPTSVVAGQTVDIFVTMTAPEAEETYRSDWQIADANGSRIGIDGFLENVFWVQIVVGTPAESTPTPEPGSASIGGVAWRDFCSSGNPGGTCVEAGGEGSGIFRGNGTFDGFEAPLVGLTITLAQNQCPTEGDVNPSDILTTTLTVDDGTYRFTGLDQGVYCIFVDAFSPENVDLLIPGDFSWPAVGVNRSTFFLDPGEQEDRIDFGWDDADD